MTHSIDWSSSHTAKRRNQGFFALAAVLVVVGSWYWMQIVHESGHVVGALLTGGKPVAVHLQFTAFSRTDVSPNPCPLIVAWAGPMFGSVVPLAVWCGVRRSLFGGTSAFLAGFCLVANGAYIGIGSMDGVGDAGNLLGASAPRWTLWFFGLVAGVGGLVLWHLALEHARAAVDTEARHPRRFLAPAVFAASAAAVVALV